MKYSFHDINGAVQTVDYENVGNKAFNVDCMVALKETPDKFYDLCICDPPYGLGSKITSGGSSSPFIKSQSKNVKRWDISPPRDYFKELFRVSQNQIIWGGNHFSEYLPSFRCFIFWDKTIHGNSYADGELAWTSFDKPARCYPENIDTTTREGRIHPTQKSIKLYKFLLCNYAKEGDRILDTHLGSGSSRIAAYDLGFDFVGYEIDADYFAAQEERFNKHTAQIRLFDPAPKQQPEQLQII